MAKAPKPVVHQPKVRLAAMSPSVAKDSKAEKLHTRAVKEAQRENRKGK